jgi:hypothetical protein
MRTRQALALLCASGALALARASPVDAPADARGGARALPLALPDDTHTKLVLQPEAVEWLRGLRGPIALVSIIGPYRSGKSFLLNRLLDVPCERGFTVGHRRTTQTKGIWLWSAPMPDAADDAAAGGGSSRGSILFLDTEGIEGAGASAVYDDRVFSLAALLSSVLIYNLPETIREDDVAKLAFVAELAHEFGRRVGGAAAAVAVAAGAAGPSAAKAGGWSPPSLLWLIQRDFLQGAGAAEHVAQSLRPVPNPTDDEHVARLNAIREAVGVFPTVHGIGLPQPSLDRTRLCDLADARQLPAEYSARLGAVSAWVRAHALPLAAGAHGGAGLAELAGRALDALNAQEIPSVANVVSTFNSQLVARCARAHAEGLGALALPVDEGVLAAAHAALLADAQRTLVAQSFGANSSAEADLAALCAAAAAARRDANFKASHETCAAGWAACAPALAALRTALLPSRARLDAALSACNTTLAPCAGPAAAEYIRRAADAATAAVADVGAQYESKLTAVLSCGALGLVAFGRFGARSGVVEGAGWLLLFALEIAPRLDVLGGGGRGGGARLLGLAPDSARAKAALGAYERAVYNRWYDADALLPWAPVALVACALARLARARRRQRGAAARERPRGAAAAAAGGGGSGAEDGAWAAGSAPVDAMLSGGFFGSGGFGGAAHDRSPLGFARGSSLSQVTVQKDE